MITRSIMSLVIFAFWVLMAGAMLAYALLRSLFWQPNSIIEFLKEMPAGCGEIWEMTMGPWDDDWWRA